VYGDVGCSGGSEGHIDPRASRNKPVVPLGRRPGDFGVNVRHSPGCVVFVNGFSTTALCQRGEVLHVIVQTRGNWDGGGDRA
jgi:hypothetical protein